MGQTATGLEGLSRVAAETLSGLVAAIREVVAELARRAVAGEPQATLDEFLEPEEPLAQLQAPEDFPRDPARVLEPGSVELHFEERVPAVSVDGSSRVVRCMHANLVVASVAAVSSHHGVLLAHPPASAHWPPRWAKGLGEPFISLQPKVELRGEEWSQLEERMEGLARLRSLAGYPYDHTYNTWQVMDEARLSLETAALRLAIAAAGRGVVVMDGPLHPLPRILFRSSYRGVERYVESYLAVARERSRILEEARSRGVALLGLVKRVSGSYKLYRIGEVVEFFRRRGASLRKLPDDYIVDLMTRMLMGEGRVRPPVAAVIYGPFHLSLEGMGEEVRKRLEEAGRGDVRVELVSRELYFAWIPPHPYTARRASVLRLEAPPWLGRDRVEELASLILALGVSWRIGVPRVLDYADRIARRRAKAYFVTLARGVETVTPLLYETREELLGVEGGG